MFRASLSPVFYNLLFVNLGYSSPGRAGTRVVGRLLVESGSGRSVGQSGRGVVVVGVELSVPGLVECQPLVWNASGNQMISLRRRVWAEGGIDGWRGFRLREWSVEARRIRASSGEWFR